MSIETNKASLCKSVIYFLIFVAAAIVLGLPNVVLATTGNLVSPTFDTGYANGVTYNTLAWLGTLGTGTSSVQFQFASSNCSNGASNPPTCSGGGTITGPIDSFYKWAWNDIIGWIDFYETDTVRLLSNKLQGYTNSLMGYIALDCATSPQPNCNPSYGVSIDDDGDLSGWAWNDIVGWISFDSDTANSSYTYQVKINSSNGDFSGWAWNDILGWISFNCADVSGLCATSNYKVRIAGVSGVWNYIGPDATSSTYYQPAGPGVPAPLVSSQHNNKRYFRYKIILNKSGGGTTPTVNKVIVNWSP